MRSDWDTSSHTSSATLEELVGSELSFCDLDLVAWDLSDSLPSEMRSMRAEGVRGAFFY